MKVTGDSLVGIWATHSRFPFVRSPFYVHTDFPWKSGLAMFQTNEQVVCEPMLQAVYPAPVRVPFHSKLKFQGESWAGVGFNAGTTVSTYGGLYGILPGDNYKDRYNSEIRSPVTYNQATGAQNGDKLYNKSLTTITWTCLGTTPYCAYVGNPADTSSSAYLAAGTLDGLNVYERKFQLDFVWWSPLLNSSNGSLGLLMQANGRGWNDPTKAKHRLQTEDLNVYGCTFEFLLQPLTEAEKQYRYVGSVFSGSGPGYVVDNPSELKAIQSSGQTWVAGGVVIGDGDDQVRYRVKTTTRFDFIIERNETTVETDWLEIGRVPGADSAKNNGGQSTSFSGPLLIEFRLICGRLSVRIGDLTTPFYFEESRIGVDGALITKIWRAEVEAESVGWFGFYFRPLCFYAEAALDSDEFQTGFFSTNIGDPVVEPAQELDPLWEVYVDGDNSALTGPTCDYRLKFAYPESGTYRGAKWTYEVAPIRAVHLSWIPVLDQGLTLPAIAGPRDVEVSHVFNLDSLTIRSKAVLGFDAQGVKEMPTGEASTYGEWAINQGLVAVEIGMGRNTPAVWGSPGEGYAANTVFTGYGKTKDIIQGQGANNWRYEMHCDDRFIQLDTQRWALPWMDGWNQFYAAMYICQLHGISPNEMIFRDFVPNEPFGPGSDLGSPEGLPAYYLPVGDQGSELTRFSTAKGIDVLAKWGKNIGYIQYFNALGGYNFHKFILPQGVKRSFFESDVESSWYQPDGGLEGMWDVTVEVDRLEVRSEAILVGLSAFAPKYKPIVYRQSDEGVVFDPLAFNHLGFRNPSAVMDSQFANDYYAWRASVALLFFLRYPALSVSWTTWLQPDLFPGDVVMLQSRRTGTKWIRMMITSIVNKTSIDGLPYSKISASFVPDLAELY